MRKLAVMAVPLLLAACATPPTPQQVQARVAAAPDIRLCASWLWDEPYYGYAAGYEIRRRGVNCDRYLPSLEAAARADAAKRQADAAAMMQMSNMFLQASRPAPMMAPQSPAAHTGSERACRPTATR